MTDKSGWLIHIPSQGINVSSSDKEKILKFFDDEIAFFRNLSTRYGDSLLVPLN